MDGGATFDGFKRIFSAKNVLNFLHVSVFLQEKIQISKKGTFAK